MYNHVVLVGRLTSDPQLRYTQQGTAIAAMRLAVDRPFTNQDGQREADFINVVVFGRRAETAANFLAKGRLALVEGRLQTRSYEDQGGQRRWVTEVLAREVKFLDRPRGQAATDEQQASATPAHDGTGPGAYGFPDDDDDEIPF